MRNHHRVGDDVGHAQRPQRLHRGDDVGLLGIADDERLEGRRSRHQPQAQLGDDAEIGLREDSVEIGTKAPFEHLPGIAVGQRSHAGAQHLAGRQHHFHAAREQEMLAIGRVADATIDRVAERPGDRRRGRAGQPQRQLALVDVIIQLLVGHAGLDESGAQIGIDIENAVHAAQIHHHLAAIAGRRRAVAEILAGRDRPDRHPVLVADGHAGLHLLDRNRGYRGGWGMLGVGHRQHDLAIGGEVLGIDIDAVVAECGTELGDRRAEVALGNAIRQGNVLCSHGSLPGSCVFDA